jgi:hypothetical protein
MSGQGDAPLHQRHSGRYAAPSRHAEIGRRDALAVVGRCEPGYQRRGDRRAVMLAILPRRVPSSFLAGSQRSSMATSPSRLDSPSDRSRRLTAVGESATFFTQVERSWSANFATSTSRTAIAPAAAARRSSYAARRHAWEHHLRGRPLGVPIHGVPQRRQVPRGAAGRVDSPVVSAFMRSEATTVRTKRTPDGARGVSAGEGFVVGWSAGRDGCRFEASRPGRVRLLVRSVIADSAVVLVREERGSCGRLTSVHRLASSAGSRSIRVLRFARGRLQPVR